MRILILLRDGCRNGITTYNRVLAQALRSQGHSVSVWPQPDAPPAVQTLQALCLHPWSEPVLRHVVGRFAPDLVFVSHYSQARLAQRLRETMGIPWFACMHNGHAPRRMKEWQLLLHNCSGVVTMCRSMFNLYSALADGMERRVPVCLSRLPLEIPVGGFVAAYQANQPLTLAYCARLSSQKGPRCEAWLRAIALLPDTDSYRIRVIGGGSHLRSLSGVARELGLNVEFTGMVRDPAPYLSDSDVLAGAGYALMEGLVRGCAGVGLGFGGCWGVVSRTRLTDALDVNFGDHMPHPLPSDPDVIAQALSQAIALRRSGEAAEVGRMCKDWFDPHMVARQLVDFWSEHMPDRH